MSYESTPHDPQSSTRPVVTDIEEVSEFEEVVDLATDEDLADLEEAAGEEPIREAEPEPEPQPAEEEPSDLEALRAKAAQFDHLHAAHQQAAQQQYFEQQRQYLEQQQKAAQEEFDEYPAEYLRKEIQALRQERGQEQARSQAIQVVNHLEDNFRQQAPDYDEALNFAREERARMIRATNPQLPEEQLRHMIQQGDELFAYKALQGQKDPAREAYEAAVRMGYKPGKGGRRTAPARQQQSTYQQPVRQRPQATSLSATSGRTAGRGTKITAAQVATVDMSDPDDIAWFDDLRSNPKRMEEIETQGYTFL